MDSIEKAVQRSAIQLGYTTVKDHQISVITSFVRGEDVFAVLPTGYGKSLCYALLPLVFDALADHKAPSSIVIVVSPLLAIMKDQVSLFIVT